MRRRCTFDRYATSELDDSQFRLKNKDTGILVFLFLFDGERIEVVIDTAFSQIWM